MNYHKKKELIADRTSLPKVFITNGDNLKYEDYLKRHTAVEFSLVKKGVGSLTTDEASYKVCEGDIFIFSPNEAHVFEFKNPDFEILTIHTEPECIWNIGPEFPDSELLKIFFDKNKKLKNRIPADTDAAEKISLLMTEALYETQKKEKEYAIFLKAKIVSILIILLRKFGNTRKKAHIPSRSYNLDSLENTIKYIDENLTNPLDLDMIADSAHLSRSHFCTVFKRYSGISPWDYITIRRIEHSLYLLETTDMNKHDIALSCGFNNSANFYRAFAKIVKVAPGELL